MLSTFTQLVKYVECLMEIKIQKQKNSSFSQRYVVNIYTTCEVGFRFIFLYKNYKNCLVCFQIDSDKVDLILKYNNFIVVTDQKMSPFSLVMQ